MNLYTQARAGFLPARKASGTVGVEAEMQGPVVCSQCDKPETDCRCDRYCTICKGQEGIRLCVDGLYYCPDCREACDVPLADARAR